jgi:hypothetical protein
LRLLRRGDDLALLAELRRSESRAVLDELYAWLCDQATLTSLSIGKAAAYTPTNWERLTRFVDDPRIPLDNNAPERGIRGPVVGRKSSAAAASDHHTERRGGSLRRVGGRQAATRKSRRAYLLRPDDVRTWHREALRTISENGTAGQRAECNGWPHTRRLHSRVV